MDAAVAAGFYVAGVEREIAVLAMLQHKPAAFFQAGQHQVGQLLQTIQGIGWVSIDEVITDPARIHEVITDPARIQIAEHIAPDEREIADAQLLASLDDEVLLGMRQLNSRHLACTTTDKLQSDTARTSKEIEHVNALKLHAVLQQVE